MTLRVMAPIPALKDRVCGAKIWINDLWKSVGSIRDLYTPDDCWNYLKHAGYVAD